ncbi:MAG TPA: serine/threonine-protein kinase [Thermoanaerobaculia bacterium]|nr:serine/threonine-protein kinase [Thermoanaerobaculia bacterium]
MPSDSRLRLVQELFLRVADLPLHERAAVLDAECAHDPELRGEIESLLAHDGTDSTFISDLIGEGTTAVTSALEERWIGRHLGAWRITGVLGRGGMGAVYAAERDDGAFRQRAALKLIRAHLDSEHVRRRFVEERQILAQLNHPNIARLLDGGETDDGVPFLVMEAVEGVPITEHCASRNASLAERLRLFITVCHAVHFAHTQLVVHRDLKPGNILVDAKGTVKLLDFGIAKLIAPGASTLLTREGELALTPDYASPEQLRGEPVATSTDVYSLGAVLFELLTGARAHTFGAYTLPEFVRVICEERSPLPSEHAAPRVARSLRGDLDNIVSTALRKDAARRYASVERMAEDVERFLHGHPVLARGDAWSYRAGKFIRRNRAAVAAAVLVALSLVAGIVGTMWQARRAERRFQQVRGLANTFLFDFHDEIRDLPGSTRARELVVRTALKYLDNLSQEARNDAQLQMELAAAYEKVGDVLGNPRNPNLGRTDDALGSYRKSLALRETASGSAIDDADEARAVLQSHLRMADILTAAGKSDVADPHVEQAATLANRFGQPGDQLEVLMRRGDLALRRGNIVATEGAYRRAMAIAVDEARLHPGLRASTAVAWAASRVGHVYKLASRQKECLEALGIALGATKELAAAEPDRTSHLRQIVTIHNDRGDALRSPFASEGMQPRLSLLEYEESLRLAEQLAKADPSDFSIRISVLLAKLQVADTWREIDPARALPMFEAIFDELEEARRADPSNFQATLFAALTRVAYANATAAAGDLRNALVRHDEAVRRITAMRTGDRGRSISRRDSTKAHTDRGAIRLALGDVEGAADDARLCREFASQIVMTEGRPLDVRDVALCYGFSGDVARRQGHDADAARWYGSARTWWNDFARRKLDSPFLREQLASLARRRNALRRKGPAE